ncbi:MAG: trypsin-like peptidase domain-containing protein [bacterium]|nr:trypsin-like peptidase domain-containing protein [bacterium]
MKITSIIVLVLALHVLIGSLPVTAATPDDGQPIKRGVGLENRFPNYLCLVKVCERPFTDVGSGAFLRSDLVLTCAHNVRDLSREGTLKIHCMNGETYTNCKVVALNKRRDLCLIKIYDQVTERKAVRISLFQKAPQHVASLGWEPSTSSMIFDIGERNGKVYGLPGGSEGIWIGHTAKVVQGMSGGPLIDAYGELVGVNVSTSLDGKESHAVALKHVQTFLSNYSP